jgi:hypothetical protein
MATKTKAKAAVRTGTGKGGRRTPVKRSRDLPLLPIAVAGILLAFAIGIAIYILVNNKAPVGPTTAGGIPCDSLQHSQVHYHAGIQIVYQGTLHPIPANIGISGDPAAPSCYYWLHVHAADPNVIHIESPANQTFTLGQFFAVWDAWSKSNGGPAEPLDTTHVSSFTLTPDQKLTVYVTEEGKSPQPYTGDPKAIVLKAHEVITLEITPPEVTPPPAFTFPNGT